MDVDLMSPVGLAVIFKTCKQKGKKTESISNV